MSVYRKLMQARVALQSHELKKSGHNKFSGYNYFELGDFLPQIQSIFNDLGLCGYVSFGREFAELTITDSDDNTSICIISPMASAELKGAHPIQQMGAVQTYQRRYLWMVALEIVEHDVLDATTGSEVSKADKPAAKLEKPVINSAPPKMVSATIKVDPNVTNWVQAAIDATHVALDLADSAADVMDVFKSNRAVYDRLKTEDAASYETLMQLFKTIKESLTK